MGCHFLLQGIFLTQGSNLSLLCFYVESFPLNDHEPAQMTNGSSLSAALHYAINSLPPSSQTPSQISLEPQIVILLDRGIPQEPQARELKAKCTFPQSCASRSKDASKRWPCLPPVATSPALWMLLLESKFSIFFSPPPHHYHPRPTPAAISSHLDHHSRLLSGFPCCLLCCLNGSQEDL